MSDLDKRVIGSLNMLDNLNHKIRKKQEEKNILNIEVVKLKNILFTLTKEKWNIEKMNKIILKSKTEINELQKEKYYLQTRIKSLKGQCKVYEQVTKKMEKLQEKVDILELRHTNLQK